MVRAGYQHKGSGMKDLFGVSIYKWLAITLLYVLTFNALGYVFSISTNLSFFDYGFLSFVTLWCEQQDKVKRESNL
jgi:hypothetical protein